MRFNDSDIIDFVRRIYPIVIHDIKVTENIFVEIENKIPLKQEYDILSAKYTSAYVNTAIGYLVKNIFNWDNAGRATATRTKLIKSFEKHTPNSMTII